MFTLDAVTKTYEIVLAGAVAANQLPVVVDYVDITTTTCLGGCSDTATNSTTPVTIVAAPGASTQRHVETISVHNADTASVTFTISLNNNSTLRSRIKITLLTLENFLYERGKGWTVYDTSGNVKYAFSGNVSDTAYDESTWNGVTTIAPSKNSVRDEMELKADLINPAFTSPDLGTASAGILTNCTGLPIRSYLAGLTLSNDAGDTAHDIAIAIGAANVSTNDYFAALSSILTKQIDATWAAGDDAGGMNDAETVGNATWYHDHLLYNPTSGAVDAGFDTSITATNLLADVAVAAAGFTKYRRIGSVLTDGSANIVQFIQYGDKFLWATSVTDVAETNPGTAAVTRTLSTPLGVVVEAMLAAGAIAADTYFYLYLSSLSTSDETPVLTEAITVALEGTGITTIRGKAQCRIFTNTSSQIRSRVVYTTAGLTFCLQTLGWIDSRGRDN